MRKVTKEQYYESFMNKDAVLSLKGNYPYTAEWTLRGSREIIAKSVEADKDENGNLIYPNKVEYFII